MQTAIDTDLITFDNWTLRVRSTPGSKRLLVLIHGFTGDENSMWVFAQNLPAQYWMVAPRAPYATEPFGYSWRPLPFPDPSNGSHRPDGFSGGQSPGVPSLEQLRPAAEALIRLIDAYSSSAGLDAGSFDVMGFSQGAVLSSILAFLYPQRIRKIGILAGFVPKELEILASKRPLEGRSIFVTHGTQDETVTIDRARDSIRILEKAGARVVYCEDEVGHKVSVKCLQALKSYFSD